MMGSMTCLEAISGVESKENSIAINAYRKHGFEDFILQVNPFQPPRMKTGLCIDDFVIFYGQN